MANLTLEGREEFRAYVEEKLKEVPEGKRIQLPKETLEKLLFEEVVVNEEKNIIVKFPVWSGEFLRKLDLSEVDFENVDWTALWWLKNDVDYRDAFEFSSLYRDISDKGLEKRLEKVLNLERLYGADVNYSGTNGFIDLAKSFQCKYIGRPEALACNFAGCNVIVSDKTEKCYFQECDFSNSTLKLKGKYKTEHFLGSNFENCDLSGVEYDITSDLDYGVDNCGLGIFKNTGAKLFYDKEYVEKTELDYVFSDEGMSKYFEGCYVNGKYISPSEERKKNREQQEKARQVEELRKKEELQTLKEEIIVLFGQQQEEDKPKQV